MPAARWSTEAASSSSPGKERCYGELQPWLRAVSVTTCICQRSRCFRCPAGRLRRQPALAGGTGAACRPGRSGGSSALPAAQHRSPNPPWPAQTLPCGAPPATPFPALPVGMRASPGRPAGAVRPPKTPFRAPHLRTGAMGIDRTGVKAGTWLCPSLPAGAPRPSAAPGKSPWLPPRSESWDLAPGALRSWLGLSAGERAEAGGQRWPPRSVQPHRHGRAPGGPHAGTAGRACPRTATAAAATTPDRPARAGQHPPQRSQRSLAGRARAGQGGAGRRRCRRAGAGTGVGIGAEWSLAPCSCPAVEPGDALSARRGVPCAAARGAHSRTGRSCSSPVALTAPFLPASPATSPRGSPRHPSTAPQLHPGAARPPAALPRSTSRPAAAGRHARSLEECMQSGNFSTREQRDSVSYLLSLMVFLKKY